MERRDRSLVALKELIYIDNQDDDDLRAQSLSEWVEKYLNLGKIDDFDLTLKQLHRLSELFYKNIKFMKKHRIEMKNQIDNHKKIREFLK